MKIEGPAPLSFPEGGKPPQDVTLSAIQYAVLTAASHLQGEAIAQAPPMKSTGPASVAPPQAKALTYNDYDFEALKMISNFLKGFYTNNFTEMAKWQAILVSPSVYSKCSPNMQQGIDKLTPFDRPDHVADFLQWFDKDNLNAIKDLFTQDPFHPQPPDPEVVKKGMDIIYFLAVAMNDKKYSDTINKLWSFSMGGGSSLGEVMSKFVIGFFWEENMVKKSDPAQLKKDMNDFLNILPQNLPKDKGFGLTVEQFKQDSAKILKNEPLTWPADWSDRNFYFMNAFASFADLFKNWPIT